MQALTRAARTTLLRPQSRSMSGSLSLEEEVKQMNLWKVVTIFGALFFSGGGRGDEAPAGASPQRP